jgi:predicted DNA-binding transcriptional regulator AlpA
VKAQRRHARKSTPRKSRKAKRSPNQKPRDGMTDRPLNPDFFYRMFEGPLFFGVGRSQMNQLIAGGKIPKPIPLTDGGRAKGWFGSQIIQWKAERLKAAEAAQAQAR